ncbi:MAG TPA: MFS transporter [Actinobacteria bacterium]|jgi:MHS family alpha-ketoglutarate permease-like MFS transporter|nr:MFS transporter [Actinomycetota bacterium]
MPTLTPVAHAAKSEESTPNRPAARAVIAGGIGSFVEWFDYSIYALFAGYFATQFFPSDSKAAALLATFGIFAVGFLARPVGAWFFGRVSDRYGRRFTLVISVILISASSLIIGLCPTAATIGLWAGVILLLARLLQGLAMGGEHASAPCYLVEQAPSHRRALFASAYSSMSIAGSLAGAALGLLLTSMLSSAQMTEFGWRIPFVLGALLGMGGLIVRRIAHEAELPSEVAVNPLRTIWTQHRQSFLRVIPIAGAMSLAYWTLLGAFPEMAIAQGVSSSEAFAANTVGLLVMMMLLPLFAMASDRFGRRTVLGGGLLAQAVVVVPALFILEHNPSSVIFIQIAVAIPAAAIEGALYATLVEKFPARLRGVGMGLSMALGVALLGGTSPLVQTAMTNAGIPLWGFGLYVLTVLLLAGVLALRMPETAHMPLRIA